MRKITWKGGTGRSKGITLPKDVTERNNWDVNDLYHINYDAGYAMSLNGEKKPGYYHDDLIDSIPVIKKILDENSISDADRIRLTKALDALEKFK